MNQLWIYWLVVAVIMLAFFLGLGLKIKGRWVGILIDSRNGMSLSRFQIVMWTWLIVSAFFAVALKQQTMSIVLPSEIWALMGISVGSTTGAVMIKSNKNAKGVLATNSAIDDASWPDMFKGEEETDKDYIDIAKVQMFFFTLALVLGYFWALWPNLTIGDKGVITFPALSAELLTLLGISHVGYLTIKATPKK